MEVMLRAGLEYRLLALHWALATRFDVQRQLNALKASLAYRACPSTPPQP